MSAQSEAATNPSTNSTDEVATTAPALDNPKPEIPKPTKTLPTDRISFGKHLDILRAFGSAKGAAKTNYVTAKQVAAIVNMAHQTVSMGNQFWVDIGLLSRAEGQGFTVSSELTDYAHAYDWDPETAAHKLAPALEDQWFWDVLAPQLRFKDLSESDAIKLLSEKASAAPVYRPRLALILDYLAAAGMVVKADGQISIVRPRAVPPPVQQDDPAAVQPRPVATPSRNSSPVETRYNQKGSGISFEISVNVDMSEIQGWQPDRITAFFGGIAQVIAAKGAMERDLSKE